MQSEIPADVMEAARKCAGEWNLIDAIAKAILAERARCEAALSTDAEPVKHYGYIVELRTIKVPHSKAIARSRVQPCLQVANACVEHWKTIYPEDHWRFEIVPLYAEPVKTAPAVAVKASEPVAWRWRSTLFSEWNLSEKPPVDQQSMEQLTALNMEGIEWQALYADTVGPDFFEVEEIREQKLATIAAPDNGTTSEVLAAVLECAEAWVPEARIIGNVRAGDIARVVRSALSAQVQDVAGETDQFDLDDEPTIIRDLEAHLSEIGHTTVGQDIRAAILVMRDAHQKCALMEDKIECLDADLSSAVEVAFNRGAKDWVRLNYPSHYARLAAAPAAKQGDEG